jgi:peroxiredoxin
VVLGISIDAPGVARRTVTQLGLQFPLLSDPQMRVIRQYDMKGQGMQMADMGYVIIDRQGRIRVRKIDRQFGAHARDILAIIRHLRTV